jgi:hypothetical protein
MTFQYLKKHMFNIKILLPICCFLASDILTAQTADIIVVTNPTTNTAANNGNMTINIGSASTTAPYVIEITGPLGYNYTATVSASPIILSPLSSGDYTGTITGSNSCIARFTARVKKCKTQPVIGGGTTIVCTEVAEPGGGDVKRFFATGYVDDELTTPEPIYTFIVFHDMPDYLYEQIYFNIRQSMTSEIKNLIQADYSSYEVFEQDEFQSNAPYIFAFNADGSLLWVYRNLRSQIREGEEYDTISQQKVGKVFPNPASNSVSIPIEKTVDISNLSFKIVNCFGQVVYSNILAVSSGTENFVIDISELPTGVYFIQVTDIENKQVIYKLIKK